MQLQPSRHSTAFSVRMAPNGVLHAFRELSGELFERRRFPYHAEERDLMAGGGVAPLLAPSAVLR